MRMVRVSAALCALAVLAACAPDSPPPDQRLRVEVVGTRPHDVTAFTQGLEVAGDRLLEGTGISGESQIRAADMASGDESIRIPLPDSLFGEGITATDDAVWQITWKDGIAIERDPVTLVERRRVDYDGEGWGLCDDGRRLVMSDGTDTLTFRDRETFAVTGTVEVQGASDARLNELECLDDGTVLANTWPTSTILRIDPREGRVTADIDASGLLDRPGVSEQDREHADVLNGIAAVPGTDRFLLTGKYWPLMFEVRFVPVTDLGQN